MKKVKTPHKKKPEQSVNSTASFIFISGAMTVGAAGLWLCATTLLLWACGVQKTAHVISLDHSDHMQRGAATYYYNVELDGLMRQEVFAQKLQVGADVQMLELKVPGFSSFVSLGTRQSSLFEIWCLLIGGRIMGSLVLGIYIWFAWTLPKEWPRYWRQRPRYMGGSSGR